MSESIRRGVETVAQLPVVRAVVLLACDQAAISAEVIEQLCAAFDGRPRRCVASEYAGNVGVPALFERSMFDDLANMDGVDLLLTLDVIHDLPRPGDAVRAARSCLSDDGIWLVADIKTRGGLEDNRKIPVLPMMYGMSILYCMSSAMSEPGGAGLGTLGLTEAVFGELTAAAGFASVETREFDIDPLNRYFEVRVG